MNPRPTADELAAFYRDVYWREWGVGGIAAKRRKQATRATYISRLLRGILGEAGYRLGDIQTVLEIGSSFGETLRHLSDVIASEGRRPQLFGIEPSEEARTAAADAYEGVEIIGHDIADLTGESKQFDLVVLCHVLEHLPQPVQALSTVRNRLGERGLLYVEVPNYYGHPSVEFAHNFCFTPLSLRNTLGAAGFRILDLQLTGHQEDFAFYISAVAAAATGAPEQKYREAVETIRPMRAKAKEDFQQFRQRFPRPA